MERSPLSTRETVCRETPARRAISRIERARASLLAPVSVIRVSHPAGETASVGARSSVG